VAARTPSDRVLAARIAAHSLHAQGGTNTGPAREAFLGKFEREVDPDALLDPAERARRAEHARKAYFARLSLAGAKKRRGQKQANGGGAAA
jgi:hypothetical protein